MVALIEIDEKDIQKLGVPFTLYGIYKHNASKKLKAQFLLIADLRKQMSEAYKVMNSLEEANDDR
ncbi:unnamed protein product [marine sediment metagenome]|uniref:Uncharacterized protein n=1 Tax=marine sediment metagenome TaxID=412755 RepID=X1BVV5_9ZZZZ